MSDPEPLDAPSPLDVLFFESGCLVINKPGGILTQAPPGIESVEAQVRRFFREQPRDSHDTAPVYVGMPHRLDRPASGVMLFGQDKAITRKLAMQFEKRTVKKTYWVIVEGIVPTSSGTWSDWMRKVPDQAESEIVSQATEQAQLATLSFEVLQRSEKFSWLQIQLETGRTHQIRLQCASRGWPVRGDQQYGGQAAFGPPSVDQRQRWIALHARSIDFWHPRKHAPEMVTAPLSQHWRNVAEWDWEANLFE